jgi:hypothetical protein
MKFYPSLLPPELFLGSCRDAEPILHALLDSISVIESEKEEKEPEEEKEEDREEK